jgi:DNA-binding transcriptional LysR family regulator
MLVIYYIGLRAFHAVASAGGYTRAAQMLNVTQPTLSGQVKALEERYGVRLFQRRGRGVELTELGRQLHDVTRRLTTVEAEAEQLLAGARSLTGGQLRVAADAPTHVIALLAAFSRRHPGVRLAFSFGNSGEVRDSLLARRSEIAVLAELEPDPRIYALAIRRDRQLVFVNRGHPWARRRSLRLEEVAGETLILREPGRRSLRLEEVAGETLILREPGSTTRAVFEAALTARGIRPERTIEIGSREAVREAVAAGLGIGVIFESEYLRDGRLHTLSLRDAKLEAVQYAACLEDRRAVRVVRAFFDLLRETLPGEAETP